MKYIFGLRPKTSIKVALLAIMALFAMPAISNAQTEESDFFFELQHNNDSGVVTINQDARLHHLVDKHIKQNRKNMTITGYKIQIYSGSGKRKEAIKEMTIFKKQFPKVPTELLYNEPSFKVRVGEFRTKQEGYKLYKRILKYFPNAYFVIDNKMEWPAVKTVE